ncbi:MAG: HAD family hydrolase [Clostridia bacterium]|nr:HAD family hydrolase [Clostridia bacterium]
MLKLIIFDLDGTLLNTSKDIHKVLNESLAHFYLPQVSLQDTISMVGNGAKKLVEAAVPPEHKPITNLVYEFYSRLFAECSNDLTTLYPDEDTVLLKLKSLGVKFAVVTNKPSAATKNVCSKHLGAYGLDMVIGGGGGFALKPDAGATLHVMQSLGVTAEQTIFVGDGETDVQTAAAAGIKCISVLWGYRSQSQLKAAGATLFAKSYTQFLQILQEKFL